MEKLETKLKGVYIIEPRIFSDMRGYFCETLNVNKLHDLGIKFVPVQENNAYSLKKGTIRGLHFQNNPYAQAKLVRCTKGAVMDYAIDLRRGSDTYLKWVGVELTEENHRQLYMPKGFAHGVISLKDDTLIEYYVDEVYAPEVDRSIRFDDPDINIDWGIDKVILSEKDKAAVFIKESDCNFTEGE